jgi:hypothetical protein
MIPGSGCRPKYTPRREPETPRGYGRREEYERDRGPYMCFFDNSL